MTFFHILAIHCAWGDWTLGECSVTCGIGTRVDTRVKTIMESNGGKCDGCDIKIESCINVEECPEPEECKPLSKHQNSYCIFNASFHFSYSIKCVPFEFLIFSSLCMGRMECRVMFSRLWWWSFDKTEGTKTRCTKWRR